MVARCPSVTREGKPCSATPRPGSAYCAWHDPDLSKRRSEWSAKGGSARSNKQRAAKALPTELMSTDEIAAWLTIQYRKLIAGQLEAGIATASATVAKAIIEISKAALVEERLAEVEQVLGIDSSNRRTS